jgi:hypothetical protein
MRKNALAANRAAVPANRAARRRSIAAMSRCRSGKNGSSPARSAACSLAGEIPCDTKVATVAPAETPMKRLKS